MILSGAVPPFLVGCHCAATSGYRLANELVTDTRIPAQHGQPLPFMARLEITASQSWSGPSGHIHQAFLAEPARTWSGVRLPFFVGCHCAANSGWDWLSVVLVIVCPIARIDNLDLGLRIYATRCWRLGVGDSVLCDVGSSIAEESKRAVQGKTLAGYGTHFKPGILESLPSQLKGRAIGDAE